jgi:hypothetical protein
VYAYPNWDVDKPSFFLQEFNALIVAMLILELLRRWYFYFMQWRKELHESRNGNSIDNKQVFMLINCLSRQFIHWQVCSIIFAGAFLPYTVLFWLYVSKYADLRYLPHAIIVHVLWGMCWLAISLPLMQTWHDWVLRKAMYASKASEFDQSEEPHESEETAETTEKPQSEKFPDSPIGFWNVTTSIITALFAFSSPIIKALS